MHFHVFTLYSIGCCVADVWLTIKWNKNTNTWINSSNNNSEYCGHTLWQCFEHFILFDFRLSLRLYLVPFFLAQYIAVSAMTATDVWRWRRRRMMIKNLTLRDTKKLVHTHTRTSFWLVHPNISPPRNSQARCECVGDGSRIVYLFVYIAGNKLLGGLFHFECAHNICIA